MVGVTPNTALQMTGYSWPRLDRVALGIEPRGPSGKFRGPAAERPIR